MVEDSLDALQEKSVENNEQTGNELFQVVDDSVIKYAEEHKPRETRTIENSNPTTEAVNARMKLSFVCRCCGELHYPKSYVPNKCLESIPRNEKVQFSPDDSFLLSAGTKPKTPPQADAITDQPYGRDDQMVAIADIDGYIERKREEVVRARANAIEEWSKIPFDEDLKVRGSTKDDEGDATEGDPDIVTHKGIYSIYTGKHWVSTTNFLNWWYPMHAVTKIGASTETLIDIATDGLTALVHYHSAMTMPNKPRPLVEKEYKESPKLVLFHEHYLFRTTNRVTHDTEIWNIPTKITKIKDALKEIDAGRAGRVR